MQMKETEIFGQAQSELRSTALKDNRKDHIRIISLLRFEDQVLIADIINSDGEDDEETQNCLMSSFSIPRAKSKGF